MLEDEKYQYRYRFAEIMLNKANIEFNSEVNKYTEEELKNESFRLNLCGLYANKFSKELANLNLNDKDSFYFEGYIHYFIFSLDDAFTGDNFSTLFAYD